MVQYTFGLLWIILAYSQIAEIAAADVSIALIWGTPSSHQLHLFFPSTIQPLGHKSGHLHSEFMGIPWWFEILNGTKSPHGCHGCHGLQVPELCSARCVSLAHLPRDAHFVRAPENFSAWQTESDKDLSSLRRQHGKWLFRNMKEWNFLDFHGFSWIFMEVEMPQKRQNVFFFQQFPASSFPAIGNGYCWGLSSSARPAQTSSFEIMESMAWFRANKHIQETIWFPYRFPSILDNFTTFLKFLNPWCFCFFFWCFTQSVSGKPFEKRRRGSTCNPLPATLQQHAQEASRMCIPVMRCYTHV